MNENQNMKEDNFAAIGIGAMIVFIALILVAAVASAVIIQTGEKLQQNAQDTGDDTQNSMRGKVKILGGYLEDGGDYNILIVASPGSADIPEDEVIYTLHCAAGTDTIIGGTGNAALTGIDGGAATDITANEGFMVSLNPANCLTGEITMHIHVKGMGTTYEVFDVPGSTGDALV
jgi:archaellum component FlaG (FlaF/FlaG flagellin family)